MKKPNIIFILADDLGYGDAGCYNPESRIPTPNLDRLAARGVRFTDAHAPSSVCTPSRYAVLTGRYCWRSRLKGGVLWQWESALVEPDRLTVAGLLRRQGYRTHCVGKWHLGWDWTLDDGSPAADHVEFGTRGNDPARLALNERIDYGRPVTGGPVDCGFDTYFGDDVPNFPPYTWFEQDRVVEAPSVPKPEVMFGTPGPMVPGWSLEQVMPTITRRAERVIEEAGEEPFFLYLPLTAPHTPIVPLDEFRGMSRAGEYGDYVCEVDWCVGRVMEALERRGIAGNTLLIFTSDNGPERPAYDRIRQFGHSSSACLRGLKRDVWEGGHRVPFLARWPGVTPAGAECSHTVMLGDLMSTCAEMTGARLAPGQGEDSVSMLPLLRRPDRERGVRAFTVHHSMNRRFAIRRGEWVFVDDATGGDVGEPEWYRQRRGYAPHDEPGELFHLASDIGERTNLYAERPEVVAELSRLLQQVKAGGVDARAPEA